MTPAKRHSRAQRGAALIVAVGILTFLLILTATLFQVTQQELQTARNNAESIRAELLVEGAFSIAQGFLNHDLDAHPTYTSLDHAWSSYFNNTWAVGKPWMWALNNQGARISQQGLMRDPVTGVKGIPEIRLSELAVAGGRTMEFRTDPSDPLSLSLSLNDLGDGLYVPRVDATTPGGGLLPAGTNADGIDEFLNGNHPFVWTMEMAVPPMAELFGFEDVDSRIINENGGLETMRHAFDGNLNDPSDELLPAEQIHFYTDVDNDGDGLNDSAWIPLAGDRLLDRDGLDNNLNGTIDEPGEPGVFFYRRLAGGNAQSIVLLEDIDNGIATPGGNTEIVFTVPFPFLVFNGTTFEGLDNNFVGDMLRVGAGVVTGEPILYEGRIIDGNPAPEFTPGIDNDYDLVVDNGLDAYHILVSRAALVYTGRINGGESALEAVYPYAPLINAIINGNGRVLAEPVSEIVGRAAILIRDEASKININAAGGHSFLNDSTNEFPDDPMLLASADGVAPHEYNLSVLPNFAANISPRTWLLRQGATEGLGFVALGDVPNPPDDLIPSNNNPLDYDVSLPGFGRVDDNGDLLQLALNGIDDDGDSVFYQNDGIDNDGNGIADDPGEGLRVGVDEGFRFWNYDNVDNDGDGNLLDDLAAPEGLDEPGEFQNFRPFRNRNADDPSSFLAEEDGIDNDVDDIVDEIGEFGDRNFLTNQQLKLLQGVSFGTHQSVQNFVTAHSSDKNERTRQYDAVPFDANDDGFADGFDRSRLAPSQRTVTGVKLDYNVASAEEIGRAIVDDWAYTPSQPVLHGALNPNIGNLGTTVTLLGTESAINRYARGLRQEDTTVVSDEQLLGVNSPNANGRFVFESDKELRAYQLAATIKDSADADLARTTATVTIPDPWIDMNILNPTNPNFTLDDVTSQISYTQSGIEPIRINEIMARATRRVEAEAVIDNTDLLFPILNPNMFDPNDFTVIRRTTDSRIAEIPGLILNTANEDPTREQWAIETPAQPINLSAMGIATVFRTYQQYRTVEIDNGLLNVPNPTINVPDVAQFSFQGSAELPPGRYYLTIDARVLLNDGLFRTIGDTSQIGFMFKRGTIDDDLFNNPNAPINQPEVNLTQVLDNSLWRTPAAMDNLGRAFLHYLPPTSNAELILENHLGFTVEIPAPETGEFLHVGIRMNKPEDSLIAETLAINWFEFSQEPDHEWVEVVNIDPDNAYDLSGWQLVVEGARRTVATVPEQTFIAPGGSLILGFDKYDLGVPLNQTLINGPFTPYIQFLNLYGQEFLDLYGGEVPRRKLNGIGLARGPFRGLARAFDGVTAPPLEFYQPNPATPPNNFFDRTGAPLIEQTVDFVDRDGDGVPEIEDVNGDGVIDAADAITPDDLIVSSLDIATNAGVANKPWDRIVELEIEGGPNFAFETIRATSTIDLLYNIQSLYDIRNLGDPGLIGNIVLQGGFFPNEPELDGYDNDGDNAILSRDGFDNDGDAFGLIDGIDEAFEGVDEGGFRNYGYIPSTPGQLAVTGMFLPVPGGFDIRSLDAITVTDPVLRNVVESISTNYLGTAADPPRWKEFNERRLFPGDNVIVSLYEGNALNNRVVDRVTYSQRDIENASIDDVLEIPVVSGSPDLDGDGFIDRVRQPLDDRYPSFWPNNTMGIDFYRSIERKHPLYNGDRFGTQNRFQATDGNYDDWGERMTRLERQVDLDNNGALLPVLDRFAAAGAIYDTFDHGFRASPGAPNLAHRQIENMNFDEATGLPLDAGQFDGIGDSGTPLLRRWHFTRPRLAQNPFLSTGDAMRLPHIDRSDQMFTNNEAAYLLDLASPNIGWVGGGTTLRADSTIHQTMLGQVVPPLRASFVNGYDASNPASSRFLSFAVDAAGGFPNAAGLATDLATPHDYSDDLRAVLSGIAATDPVNLTVARADVYPMVRNTDGNLGSHIFNIPPLPNPPEFPVQWAPVLSYPVVVDALVGTPTFEQTNDFILGNSDLRKRFLLNSNLLPLLAPNFVDLTRSPALSRAAAYLSVNYPDFDPSLSARDGAQALFVWDAEDGLENGEYVLYVVTANEFSGLNEQAFGLITNTSAVLGSLADAARDSEIRLDIDAYTDRNADRRVWLNPPPPLAPPQPLPDTSASILLQDPPPSVPNLFEPGGSFGAQYDLSPAPNGVIRYGTVRVENNFLAVHLRNRSAPGVLNRVSRVVLAPKNRTNGRININTIQTRRTFVDTDANPKPPRVFNALTGAPGTLLGYFEENPTVWGIDPDTNAGDPAPAIRGDFITYRDDAIAKNHLGNDIPTRSTLDAAMAYRAEKIAALRGAHFDPDYLRFEHADGRYYEFPADMVAPQYDFDTNRLVNPDVLSDLDSRIPGEPFIGTTVPADVVEPLRFDENFNRFRRLANTVTTRSDVFEIIVTVQSGFGIDANNDGRINWRDDAEFRANATKRARSVYER